MFVLDEELAEREAQLAHLQGPARLDLLAELAWHYRQRSPAHARSLAQQAAAAGERGHLEARFILVDGEAKWLFGDLDGARGLAGHALGLFDAIDDATGSADAHWLRAWVEVDSGNSAEGDLALAAAAAAARRTGDSVRIDVIDAATALLEVFRDLHTAEARWGKRFDVGADGLHPAARGWIDDYTGTCASLASEFGTSIGLMIRSFEAAMATGQVRRSINIATNIGNGFTMLNAHHAALEWMQRGLDLARPTGWPLSVGLGLMQTAETLRQLGQRPAAGELLREALATLAPLAGSRAYAVALEYQGDLALDGDDYAGALDSFARLEERGEALCQVDFQSSARRGQAHALSHLNRPAKRWRWPIRRWRCRANAATPTARSPRSRCWPNCTPATSCPSRAR